MTSKKSRGESFVIDFNQCGNTEQENIQENTPDKYTRKMPEKTQDKNLQDAFQKFKDKKQVSDKLSVCDSRTPMESNYSAYCFINYHNSDYE